MVKPGLWTMLPLEEVANGLRDVGAGAGPVDVLDLERLRDL